MQVLVSSMGQWEIAVFLFKFDFEFKVFQFILLFADIDDDIFGEEGDTHDIVLLSKVDSDFNVIEADVGVF